MICWMNDHDTGFHDHDLSSGALAVARGRIREERLGLGGSVIERTLEAGEAIDFAAADIHRVTHSGNAPAVTINAYSPPLWRMGAYEIKPTGELQRHSISYAQELRPVSTLGYRPPASLRYSDIQRSATAAGLSSSARSRAPAASRRRKSGSSEARRSVLAKSWISPGR